MINSIDFIITSMEKFDIYTTFTKPYRQSGKDVVDCINEVIKAETTESKLLDVMEAIALAGFPAIDCLRGGVHYAYRTGHKGDVLLVADYLYKFNYPENEILEAIANVSRG